MTGLWLPPTACPQEAAPRIAPSPPELRQRPEPPAREQYVAVKQRRRSKNKAARDARRRNRA
jgi:hypothetical protein